MILDLIVSLSCEHREDKNKQAKNPKQNDAALHLYLLKKTLLAGSTGPCCGFAEGQSTRWFWGRQCEGLRVLLFSLACLPAWRELPGTTPSCGIEDVWLRWCLLPVCSTACQGWCSSCAPLGLSVDVLFSVVSHTYSCMLLDKSLMIWHSHSSCCSCSPGSAPLGAGHIAWCSNLVQQHRV